MWVEQRIISYFSIQCTMQYGIYTLIHVYDFWYLVFEIVVIIQYKNQMSSSILIISYYHGDKI